jgi:hypothetical protein
MDQAAEIRSSWLDAGLDSLPPVRDIEKTTMQLPQPWPAAIDDRS